MDLRFEPLGNEHDRSQFRSGQPELDDWFRERAGQDMRRNIARVFVALDADAVVGFYSLSAFTLLREEVPEPLARRLPRYGTIPAALIGRLARDERARGAGVGELLLADAIHRVLEVGQSVAVFAIVVDAKDERAEAFYRRFGFEPFVSRPTRLYLPTATAATVLASLGERDAG